MGAPYMVATQGLTYTVVDDTVILYEACVTGSLIDEASGSPLTAVPTISVDVPGIVVNVSSGGLFALVCYTNLVFPKLATTAYTLTLTIVVGAYFLAEGVATIMYALEHRRELSERWSWLLVSGLMDILIAGVIISGLPGSALWAIGLLVGINMVFGGATLIGMALAARNS